MPGSTRSSSLGPLLLGHRGARNYAPENTFAAFDACLSHGCDGFEFDVRMTKDGVAVVFHDATLDVVPIPDLTFAEMARLVPGLVTLDQVLTRYRSRAFLNIELKVRGLEAQVSELLRGFDSQGRIVVSSFSLDVLYQMQRTDPSIPLGYICQDQRLLWHWREVPVQYVILYHQWVDRSIAEQMIAGGKKLWVWTVNADSAMLRYASLGADALISDDTRLLGETFRGMHGEMM